MKKPFCKAAVPPNTYKQEWTRCAKEVLEEGLCLVHSRLKKTGRDIKIFENDLLPV